MFDREYTAHGVVIASDREHRQLFTVRWSGAEPGAAPELASLAIDRAGAWPEFRAALARWKMPARRITYVDAEGNIGVQDAGLVPVRRGGEWVGWRTVDDLPHAFNPRGNSITTQDATRIGGQVSGDAVFAHPLAVTAATRQRFNIGPLGRPTDDDSPLRMMLDATDWDRSRAMNAPGQSESPASPHFADLAKVWSSGELVPLVFTDAAIQSNSVSTLTLVSARPR